MLTASVRSLGKRRPLLADWSVEPPASTGSGGGEPLTLRVLLEAVVRRGVAAFRERQEDARFVRALMERELADAVAAGRVVSGGSDLQQEVDEEAAVAAALVGFEDGLYLLLIDQVEQRDLDAEVVLREDSNIVFLRLVMLAGARPRVTGAWPLPRSSADARRQRTARWNRRRWRSRMATHPEVACRNFAVPSDQPPDFANIGRTGRLRSCRRFSFCSPRALASQDEPE